MTPASPTPALATRDFGHLERLLPARLLRPERLQSYLPLAWLMSFAPALLLSAIVGAVAGEGAQPKFPFGSWTVFFLAAVFAPVVETLVMGTVLLVLRLFLSPLAAVVLSSAGWGVAHSLQAPAWGLVIWWPFLIFSTVFLVWRERGLLPAFAVASLLHAMHNALPALGLVLAG